MKGAQNVAKYDKSARSLDMYRAILELKDIDECMRFFDDLCSPRELKSMEQRFDVAVYLMQDKVYTDIVETTGASSATVSRVRRNILDNEAGGAMRDVIDRLKLASTQDGTHS